MPPPRLPKAAAGLATIVADKAIEITVRQQTGVSTSDVIRGVHEAIHKGLSVVDYTLAQVVCDEAHAAPNAHDVGHRDGFCRACAAIYLAVMKAHEKFDEVPTD